MKHELNLFDNAIDSLNEALRQYGQADLESPRTYKFAILLFAQSIELLLKFYVFKQHPLFIYKNPFSNKLASGEAATIGLWEAVQLLKNLGIQLDEKTIKNLKWIKSLRNDIEHYKFSMNVPEVRITMSRLLSSLNEISQNFFNITIEDHISIQAKPLYAEIISEHHQKRLAAQKKAIEKTGENDLCDCFFCNEEKIAFIQDDVMTCYFCDTSEKFASCEACGLYTPERQMAYLGEARSFYGHFVTAVCCFCEVYFQEP